MRIEWKGKYSKLLTFYVFFLMLEDLANVVSFLLGNEGTFSTFEVLLTVATCLILVKINSDKEAIH